jgi:hypothetical protein
MVQGQDMSSNKAGINLNVNIDTNYLNPDTGLYSYPIPTQVTMQAPQPTYPMYSTWSGDVYAMNVGFSITSTSPDFTVNFCGMGYVPEVAEMALPGG